MDGVWQPSIVSYFWGQDFLGYKPQLWKALIFHWTLRTGSHFHGFFLDLSASLPWRFSLLLSSVTPTIYIENCMLPTPVSLILPRQSKDQRNIFLLCILSSGAHTMAANPLWTRLTEQSTPHWKKKKELIKKSKLNTRSVFIPLAPFNWADSPCRYKQFAEIKQSCWPSSPNYHNTEFDLKTQQQLLKVGQVSQSAHQDSDQEL